MRRIVVGPGDPSVASLEDYTQLKIKKSNNSINSNEKIEIDRFLPLTLKIYIAFLRFQRRDLKERLSHINEKHQRS